MACARGLRCAGKFGAVPVLLLIGPQTAVPQIRAILLMQCAIQGKLNEKYGDAPGLMADICIGLGSIYHGKQS